MRFFRAGDMGIRSATWHANTPEIYDLCLQNFNENQCCNTPVVIRPWQAAILTVPNNERVLAMTRELIGKDLEASVHPPYNPNKGGRCGGLTTRYFFSQYICLQRECGSMDRLIDLQLDRLIDFHGLMDRLLSHGQIDRIGKLNITTQYSQDTKW